MTSDDLKNKAKDMAHQAGQSAQETSESLKSAAHDAQDLAQSAASRLGEKARIMADQASDTASDLYGRVSDTVSKAAGSLPDSASDAVAKGQRVFESGSSQVVSQVKKQPLEALLLAGAIGYLVGWAANRG